MAQEDPQSRLPGGNVGGAVLIGNTVRRPTGPWTPAVHALLGYLATRIPHVPRVLGTDEQGREVLSYLPGHVIDTENYETLSLGQVDSLVRWTRSFHDVVTGFTHPGPWRYFPVTRPTLIGHNDIAPYNACFAGDEVTGIFDWDLSGPTTALMELAFIAWNCVPLWADIGPANAAERLKVIAAAYGAVPARGATAPPGGTPDPDGPEPPAFDARTILHAVPHRITAMLDWIPAAAAAGDAGLANLMLAGEPERSDRPLTGLIARIPAIDRRLRCARHS